MRDPAATQRARILAALAGNAGGRTARELLADLNLDAPYAFTYINTLCRQLADKGQVTFTVETSGYHNSKRFRWFVTDAGRAELERLRTTPARQLASERVTAAREARAALARQRADLIELARQKWEAGAISDRDGLIRYLRQEGCVLEDIAGVFGLTRERVRQITLRPTW